MTSPQTAAGRRGGLQTLDRAIAILEAFTPEHSQLGVARIARLTGLSSSTVHRILASLLEHGLVQRLPDSTYALGPRLLRLAHTAMAHVNLRTVARPVMASLRNASQETVGLHLPHGPFARLVIDQVESLQPLRRTYTEIGQPIPIHHGAPGKLLLAFRPADIQEEVLKRPLVAATPQTITDSVALRSELSRIRRRGYALSFEERNPGISTLAVPIRNHTGSVVAALSVTGPSVRLDRARLEELVRPALDAAHRISTDLGYLEDQILLEASPVDAREAADEIA